MISLSADDKQKIEKLKRLIERGSTPGERKAAQDALDRVMKRAGCCDAAATAASEPPIDARTDNKPDVWADMFAEAATAWQGLAQALSDLLPSFEEFSTNAEALFEEIDKITEKLD